MRRARRRRKAQPAGATVASASRRSACAVERMTSKCPVAIEPVWTEESTPSGPLTEAVFPLTRRWLRATSPFGSPPFPFRFAVAGRSISVRSHIRARSWSGDHGACRYRPQPGAPRCAAPRERPDHARRARSDGRTQRRGRSHARAARRGTSSVQTCSVSSPSARLNLASEPPPNPGDLRLTSVRLPGAPRELDERRSGCRCAESPRSTTARATRPTVAPFRVPSRARRAGGAPARVTSGGIATAGSRTPRRPRIRAPPR